MNVGTYIGLVAAAYLLGAIPVALVLGKVTRGIDIRDWGSGNIGAANAQRTLGWWASILVFILDIAKALVPVLLARWLTQIPALEVACALAAIVGHNWPAYINWKGGKGVSSSLGVMIFFIPWPALGGLVIGAGLMAWKRYVSLGSIVGAGLTPLLCLLYTVAVGGPVEYVIFSFIAGGLVVFQHRVNIQRLLAGTERKIGQRASASRQQGSGVAS